MTYETGVLVAFCMWLFSSVWTIVMVNSRMQRNLRLVGMRLSLVTLKPKPMTAADKQRSVLGSLARYLFVTLFNLAFVLLSWLYVAFAAAQILYAKFKDSGRPTAAREFEWKIKNIDMTFEQMAREMYALQVALGAEQREFDAFRKEVREMAQ